MHTSVFELSAGGSASINQGQYGPAVSWQRIRYIIVTPLDYFLTSADYASGISTKLQADAINDNPDQRIQIIGPIQGAESAGTDPITQTYGYGLNVQRYSGQTGFTFTFGDDDLSRQQQRQRLDGQESSRKIFLADESFKLIGTVGDDGNGGKVHQGLTPAALKASDVGFDFGEGPVQTMSVALADSLEINKGNLLVIPTSGLNLGAIKMVADVHIQAISTLTTRVVTLALMSVGSVSGLNLAQKYAAVLAANPDLLIATNHTTGAALTITSAVPAIINGQHGITYTFAVTNYPTAPSGIDLKLDVVSALADEDITYFETPETLYIPV